MTQTDFARSEIIHSGFHLQFARLGGITNDGRGRTEQLSLIPCVGFNRRIDVAAGLLHCRLEMLIQDTDLSWYGIDLQRRLYCPAVPMTNHEQHFDSQDSYPIFKT